MGRHLGISFRNKRSAIITRQARVLSQHIDGVFMWASEHLSLEMVEPEEVFDLLADDYAREILAHANRKPMSVRELADACDAHHSTIYRRIEQLQDHDLLAEQLQVDSDGHHYTMYSTTLQSLTVSLDEAHYRIQLQVKEDPIDRMAQMWHEMRGDEL